MLLIIFLKTPKNLTISQYLMSCEETCWKLNLKFQNKYANVHVFYFEIMHIISNKIALPLVQTDL